MPRKKKTESQSGGIPPRPKFFVSLLQVLKEMGGIGEKSEIIERVIARMGFSDTQVAKVTKSGQPLIGNRIAFAREILATTGYILRGGKRGRWALTDKGLNVNPVDPESFDPRKIDREGVRLLRAKASVASVAPTGSGGGDPDEPPNQSEEDRIADELLRLLKDSVSWRGFELLCKQMLSAIGFIDVKVNEYKPYQGDGGFDGTGLLRASPDNPVVSTSVAFQCKRYKTALVGDPVIRDLQAVVGVRNKAEKGVIITTSDFTGIARKAVGDGNTRIELINGEQLVRLMVDHLVGVKRVTVKDHKGEEETLEVDRKFFDQFKEGASN